MIGDWLYGHFEAYVPDPFRVQNWRPSSRIVGLGFGNLLCVIQGLRASSHSLTSQVLVVWSLESVLCGSVFAYLLALLDNSPFHLKVTILGTRAVDVETHEHLQGYACFSDSIIRYICGPQAAAAAVNRSRGNSRRASIHGGGRAGGGPCARRGARCGTRYAAHRRRA